MKTAVMEMMVMVIREVQGNPSPLMMASLLQKQDMRQAASWLLRRPTRLLRMTRMM